MKLALLNGKVVEACHSNKDVNSFYKCPLCNDDVILRKGQVNIPHFAHKRDSDCAGCDMTLTHRYAQQILSESVGKRITLNDIKCSVYYLIDDRNVALNIKENIDILSNEQQMLRKKFTDLSDMPPSIHQLTTVFSKQRPVIKDVKCEQSFQEVRPDVMITTENNNILFIEIKVRHAVDDVKLEKLVKYGIPTIEVDLSSIEDLFISNQLNGTDFDLKSEIESILFTDKILDYTEWLVEPKYYTGGVDEFFKEYHSFCKNYFYYRQKYKYMIYVSARNPQMWHRCVNTIDKVNKIAGFDLKYEIWFSNYIARDKIGSYYTYMLDASSDEIKQKLFDSDSDKTTVYSLEVDLGYHIKDGNIIYSN